MHLQGKPFSRAPLQFIFKLTFSVQCKWAHFIPSREHNAIPNSMMTSRTLLLQRHTHVSMGYKVFIDFRFGFISISLIK
jgi:hypothetical protein